MAAIARRSHMAPVSQNVTLATADDLDGTTDNTQAFNVTGAQRVMVVQLNTGTAGTAGIDVIEVSHDGGKQWAAADKVLALASDDATGTELNGILNAAGVEPTGAAVFKLGPYEGPTAVRCGRKTTDTAGTTWVTGAPAVIMFTVGQTSGAPVALA
jgi:hypothetical protein